MLATEIISSEDMRAQERLDDELATLQAHVNAATARWLELVWRLGEEGVVDDDVAGYVAFRCGLATREAREHVRVAGVLRELPAIRAAFGRGELTLTKVRALARVATPASEESLLELACTLSASQLERALRAFRRLRAEEAADAHELQYVDYHWEDDGSLVLRARLAAEDGVLVVRALEAARDKVWELRREEERQAARADEEAARAAREFEPPRPASVEALVEVVQTALDAAETGQPARARIVVHVDACALTSDGSGQSELADGPVIAPETARRLGCDAETLASVELDGLPVSVGRARRTVPPTIRRLLEARDEGSCCWPGCERRRFLDAHHRVHWAHGGETSLDNLVLLCTHHHRLVHEGGYTLEDDTAGGFRFRNRHGVLCPSVPRPPPGSAEELAQHQRGLELGPRTNRNGDGDPLDLALTLAAIERAAAWTTSRVGRLSGNRSAHYANAPA